MLLEERDKQIDVRAGVERLAALDDHGVAAVPDEIRRGHAKARRRIDRPAVRA